MASSISLKYTKANPLDRPVFMEVARNEAIYTAHGTSRQSTHLVVVHHLHAINLAILVEQFFQVLLSGVQTEAKHPQHPARLGVVLQQQKEFTLSISCGVDITRLPHAQLEWGNSVEWVYLLP